MPGHVREKSSDFAIKVSGRVALLSGVCFCIGGRIIAVYGYLGAIYSCSGVKVKQGYECHGQFP